VCCASPQVMPEMTGFYLYPKVIVQPSYPQYYPLIHSTTLISTVLPSYPQYYPHIHSTTFISTVLPSYPQYYPHIHSTTFISTVPPSPPLHLFIPLGGCPTLISTVPPSPPLHLFIPLGGCSSPQHRHGSSDIRAASPRRTGGRAAVLPMQHGE
jgi:hypothetical protein